MVEPVPEYIDFPKEEENVLKLWNSLQAFKKCLKQSKGRPRLYISFFGQFLFIDKL